MGAAVVTTSSTVLCPHGGQARLSTSQSKVEAGGAKVILISDEHAITGCAFVAGTKPQPCVKLRWIMGAMQSKVDGTAIVTSAAIGLCYSAEDIPGGPAQIAVADSQTSSN